ncbi:hypothetical protein VXQ35_16750 [Acinetobacter oleivorans]|uniref:hypothetical protein n=1 Tax=Acinetobacter oleivorans TaxID=1148157 RepID=UPI003A871ADE
MNDIFWNSPLGSVTGESYIPKGLGPFPAIIIFDTGLKKSTKTYATFYAEKMKEEGFFSFLITLNLKKLNNYRSNEISSAIEYILDRKEVNNNKIYLIEIEKNNFIDLTIELYKNYFQAIASINYFNLNT